MYVGEIDGGGETENIKMCIITQFFYLYSIEKVKIKYLVIKSHCKLMYSVFIICDFIFFFFITCYYAFYISRSVRNSLGYDLAEKNPLHK